MSIRAESYTKQDFVYSELLQRIKTGVFPLNSHIPIEKDLAEEFHCSRGTVGRAVMRLVQEGLVERKPRAGTQVVRNSLGRPASAIDLDACAFVHPSERHEGVWRCLSGFQQAAHEARRRTLMLSTGTDYSKEAEIVGRLQEFNVKGAVLFPVVTNPAEMAHYSQMILSCPYPVVLIELALPGMGRPLVVGDGMHAGYTMTRCLLDQGLRRIGFLAHYAWAPYIRDRYLGYRQAMEEAGLSIDERTVHLDPAMTPDFEDPTREPQQIAATYLDQNQDLEGVVCAMDFLALGLIEAARAKGSAVPRDLKVTGIDDIGVAASAAVPLTTYHMPYEIMGSRAFELLDEQMNGRRASRLEVQVRGELVRRVSA